MKGFPLLLAASALVAPAAAFAQDTAADQDAATASAADGQGESVIIVTAGRIETNAQDTAIALSVYSGDDLAQQGVDSVNSLTQIDPSVNVSNSGGAAYVAIRGIASTDVTEIGDPSVPIARDGFFTNRSFAINSSFYDIERVEVLKGPQGTLQGRNSTGGLISIVTKKPEFRNGGSTSVEVGNYGQVTGEMVGNLAVTDNLAVRGTFFYTRHDGYRDLTGPAGYGDDEDFASGRLQAMFENGGLRLWASYQHDSRDVNGDAALKAPLGGPKPDFGDADEFESFVPTYTKLEGDRIRWEASYETQNGLAFTYAGGWDKQDWRNALDGTGPVYPANRQFVQRETPETWNHEFRINNDSDSRLFFQAGYFRFSEDNTIDSGLYNREMTGPLFGEGGFLVDAPNADQSYRYGIKFDYGVKTKSQALFAQVEYELTEQLELSLGGRYTWDEKTRTGQAVLNLPALAFPLCGNDFPAEGTCPPFPISNPGNGALKEEEPTWHVGLNYRPTPDTLIYAKYDRGYKSGGFNSNGSAASVPYDPEKLDAFEIGAKNTLMGGNLQLNAAAFYFDYKGYQASQNSAAIGGGEGIFNVGSAKIYGVEGEMKAGLGNASRMTFNAAYLNTEFGNGITVNDGDGNPQDISGNELPNAPALSLTGGLEHDFLVAGGTLTARADAKYSSKFYYSAFNNADTRSDDYVTANASLSFAPDNGPWRIQAYVRNIFDEVVLAYAARQFVAGNNSYQFQPPRTFGVRASVEF